MTMATNEFETAYSALYLGPDAAVACEMLAPVGGGGILYKKRQQQQYIQTKYSLRVWCRCHWSSPIYRRGVVVGVVGVVLS